jgi:hypothetical protein
VEDIERVERRHAIYSHPSLAGGACRAALKVRERRARGTGRETPGGAPSAVRERTTVEVHHGDKAGTYLICVAPATASPTSWPKESSRELPSGSAIRAT